MTISSLAPRLMKSLALHKAIIFIVDNHNMLKANSP